MFMLLLYRIREAFPINRVVVFLTPAFVIAAGWTATQAAEYAPGLPGFSEGELTAFFVAGGAAALTMAYKWLDGLIKYEDRAVFAVPLEEEPTDGELEEEDRALAPAGADPAADPAAPRPPDPSPDVEH